ncbi:hypothetical protein BEN47_10915 [Hymenobacter lapidarius]|uniref:CBM6 domain-containing protein n=2 Tax=Hymenobacter lapidarius TaxID=1908237 RepID=A0A1G1T983_9BACT|nr:hypothetical protein BEN47_10915 [Hymenobacter lapidarius]
MHFEGSNANSPASADQPATPGSVGYYYSAQNSLEPLTATTSYPFSLVEEYTGPLGGTKRATGPGDAFRMGLGREGKTREFPLLNELDHYLSLRPQFVPGALAAGTLRLKGEKAVSVNANGVESLSFTDADGKPLATCLSGSQYPGLTLTAAIHADPANATGLPPYQDLHVPAAGPVTLTVGGSGSIRVVNLLTEAAVTYAAPWPAITLAPGFYRVVSTTDNQSLSYLARYGEFSYSYYDDGGRIVATIAPKGVAAARDLTGASHAGLSGRWAFNEATGLTTSDQSGNALTGALINQPAWGTVTSPGGIPPSPAGGSWLVFDGQDDYMRLGDQPALRMTSTLSLEAWIYPTSNQNGIILNKEDEYEVARFSDGSIQWAFRNTVPGWSWVNTGMSAPLNQWSHIALTYNNGVVTAYLNGTQVGTPYNGVGPISYQGGECWIGERFYRGMPFQGAIDEVRVWNTVHPPTAATTTGELTYVTRNTYSGTGTLLATESIDEGRTEYAYAKDGRIRFSQSALQRQQGRFSYSHYDEVGRVAESGEYTMDPNREQGHIFEAQDAQSTVFEAEAGQTNAPVGTGASGYSGSGYVEYLTEPGRYVTVSVRVPAAGTYVLGLRYAAGTWDQRTMSLVLNEGAGSTEQLAFSPTYAWSTWATKLVAVPLRAGLNTVKLLYGAGDNGYINLDYVQVLPPVYEAEQAKHTARYYTGQAGASGSGVIGDVNVQGRYVEFAVTAPQAGTYSLDLRYSAGIANSTRTMSVYLNGRKVQQASFPATNSWTAWATHTLTLSLPAGANTITYQYDATDNGSINLDYLAPRLVGAPSNSVLALLEERLPANGLDAARCAQRNQVWYDLPTTDAQLNGRAQEFVLGAVAKTSNGTNTTWYSYDELGRVTWLVQNLPGVGVKTVDYAYDFAGNVLEMAYQKNQPDAFFHHYAYDADQRLHTVHTSVDGQSANRTLQARYFYYLHGPLKRVEIADRLQGIDYTYTVQGWLKGINNAQRELDPGRDGPNANGTLKDLFGLRLDYFDGDFASRQLTASNPYIQPNQSEIRYDGTVRASAWSTPAAPTVHAYAHRYDPKGQLLESTYGQFYGGNYFSSSVARPYEEGNLSYDTHGNIQSLRRRDGAGTATDDFAYRYTANTNKLQAVHNPAGAAVLSYDYDVNGQMIRESEAGKGDKYLQYDVSGKVTGVFRNANFTGPVAAYAYDDRGFRSRKIVYNAQGVATNTTHYVTDVQGNVLSTYEQPFGQALQRSEVPLYGAGRLGTLTRLDDETLDARYELNDQLGNARVIFHRPTTTTYLATMEPDQATTEEQHFQNLPATRFADGRAYDGSHVAALWEAGEGPKKVLQVEKGDTVTFSAQALWQDMILAATGGNTSSSLRVVPLLMLGSLTAAPSAVMGADGQRSQPIQLNRLAIGIGLSGFGGKSKTLARSSATNTIPNVLIRFRYYDQNNVLKLENTKYISAGALAWENLQLGFRAPDVGTLELSVLNASSYVAYFDHVEVKHTSSTIVQEQHQYSYGSPLVGLNYLIGDKRYRYGFEGKYAENDEETGWNSFEARMYNSRIGRWMAPDPEGQFISPYIGIGNNPIKYVDPDGRDVIVLNQTGGASGLGHAALLIGNDKDGWDLFSKNGTEQNFTAYGVGSHDDIGVHYNSLDDFFTKTIAQKKTVYDRAIRIKTSIVQDNRMRVAARAQINTKYSVIGASCATTVEDALSAADPKLQFGLDLEFAPNRRFEQLTTILTTTKYNGFSGFTNSTANKALRAKYPAQNISGAIQTGFRAAIMAKRASELKGVGAMLPKFRKLPY